MSGEPPITIVGNLTADPELRFTPSGAAVANFTVAQTPRVKVGDDWQDGETTFFRCAVWRDVAEHVAESLQKGMRVVATGRLKTRTWQDNQGQERLSVEVDVDELGPSLRYGVTQFRKVQTGGQQQGGQQRQQRPQQGYTNDPWAQQPQQPAQGDPWGQQPQQGYPQGNPWGQGYPQQGPPPQQRQQPPQAQRPPQQPALDPWGQPQSEEPPF